MRHKINLNAAKRDELMSTSGLRREQVDQIIKYREEHGSFESVDELKNLTGFSGQRPEELKNKFEV